MISEKESTLLWNKLRIPRSRSIVPRQRLIEQLNSGVNGRLTLISAPAGFGKTTLLVDWSRQSKVPIAWISLDEDDNNLARFWMYVLTAINIKIDQVCDQALHLLRTSIQFNIEGILTLIINKVERKDEKIVLILDDYHCVKDELIHDSLAFLIEHLPPQIHLIIATRVNPPLHLAKFLIQEELVKVSVTDLRFNLAETVNFFTDVMHLELQEDIVQKLLAKTEGWAAGLKIAALSIGTGQDLPNFINHFNDSERYILDYLSEEVINNQPKDIQSFLLYTSVLEQLNSHLCNAVTLKSTSQQILDRLEENNVFITQSEDGYWYRYHQLFADSLRKRLERSEPEIVPILIQRAAKWYEENDYVPSAIKSFLLIEDYNHALGLINKIALEKIYFGELTLPLEWIKGIPENVLMQWPMILVFFAWVLIASNLQFDIADTYLMSAQEKLTEIVDKLETVDDRDPSINTLSDARLLEGFISVIRSYSARLRGDLKTAIPLAERALDFLPENQYVFRTWASWNLAEAYRYLGNIPGWGKALNDAIASCELTQNPGAILLTFDNLAELQVMRGELYKAEKTWNYLLKRENDMLEGKEIPIAATIYAGLGMLYYEWNKFDLAVRHLDKAIELAKLGRMMEIYLESHITLARLHYVCGDRESAIRIIDDLESIIRSNPINRHSIRAMAYRALWEFDRGNRGYVSRWKQERQFSKEMLLEFSHESEFFIISRMLIEDGHFQEALDLLLSLEDAAGSSGRVNSKIKALMLISVAHEGLGRNSESLSQLEKALILAEPGGYIRTFLEARGNIIDLLNQCVSRGIKRDYVYRILAGYHNQTKHLEMIQTLQEPLSDREIEVLKLVVARLTSREIADILKISVNTVRTHTRNIYSKLNVHNHVEANCRAKEIGII